MKPCVSGKNASVAIMSELCGTEWSLIVFKPRLSWSLNTFPLSLLVSNSLKLGSLWLMVWSHIDTCWLYKGASLALHCWSITSCWAKQAFDCSFCTVSTPLSKLLHVGFDFFCTFSTWVWYAPWGNTDSSCCDNICLLWSIGLQDDFFNGFQHIFVALIGGGAVSLIVVSGVLNCWWWSKFNLPSVEILFVFFWSSFKFSDNKWLFSKTTRVDCLLISTFLLFDKDIFSNVFKSSSVCLCLNVKPMSGLAPVHSSDDTGSMGLCAVFRRLERSAPPWCSWIPAETVEFLKSFELVL